MPHEAFEEVFRRDYPALIAFLCRSGFSAEHAEDAASEAMTEAYLEWSNLTSPRAWVRRVALRLATRQAKRNRVGVIRTIAGGWVTHSDDDDCQRAEVEEHAKVIELLGKLPPKQREAMAWCLDGFGIEEIAMQMAVSPATVRSHLRHARNKLRPEFENSRQKIDDPISNRVDEEVPQRGTSG